MLDTLIFSRITKIISSALIIFYSAFLSAQTLIIGTLPFNPPFETESKENQFLGLDIEIMQTVCTLIKADCQFKKMKFSEIFKQIDSGQIDLGIGSIINDITREQYLLSLPYLPSSAQFIVRSQSTLRTPSQLMKKTIATVPDPSFNKYLSANYSGNTLLTEYPAQAILDLTNGKFDALFMDQLSVNYWISSTSNQLRILGEPISIGEGYTIVAKKDQQQLIQKINEALLYMNKKGLDKTIFSIYF